MFYNGGQYQVILGTGIVTKVYDEIEKLGINVVSKAEQTAILKIMKRACAKQCAF